MTTATDPIATMNNMQNKYTGVASAGRVPEQPWSPDLAIYLSTSILIFTAIALALSTALLWRKNAPAHLILKIFGVLSIIGMSAFLLVVGYSNAQLTPIVGLFGAIAGYLLGKDTGKSNGD